MILNFLLYLLISLLMLLLEDMAEVVLGAVVAIFLRVFTALALTIPLGGVGRSLVNQRLLNWLLLLLLVLSLFLRP